MTIWHDTVDTRRLPRQPTPGQEVDIAVGTWPIEPGQHVWLVWRRVSRDGTVLDGTVAATWQYNTNVNSHWRASIGPFSDGDEVFYTVHGVGADGEQRIGPLSFHVRPLYLAWLWHQHQPLYGTEPQPGTVGRLRFPWVRLHAVRDYYSMAALAAEHDVHLTINLSPVLLFQIDHYLLNGGTDDALDLTRCPVEDLTPAQKEDLLSSFFDADWHNQIFSHERYRQLFEQRAAGSRFTRQDLLDLQMWFNLAWFGHEFRSSAVTLVTGETVTVDRFVRQARGFTHNEITDMLDNQYKVLRAIVPLHRALQEAGRIEVSTTPAFHPILPLIIDTDDAYIDRPGTTRPARFSSPEDAATHVDLACRDYEARFGTKPGGMWPAEGAVSSDAVRLIADHGVRWLATDAGVLSRSGRWGYRASEPDVLCQPYRVSDDVAPLAIFFRHTSLSDGVGFRYGQYDDPNGAAEAFVRAIEADVLARLTEEGDRLLTIVLDGENAWGGYKDDGRPFLHAIYNELASRPWIKTVTFTEYLNGNPGRHITTHPSSELQRVHELATGSWIDEPESRPGVDLGTWIGEPEENAAWALLAESGAAVSASDESPSRERAHRAVLAAEGSDWFWWFGTDQQSPNDAAFDRLFRDHLQSAFDSLGLEGPDALDDPIVPCPVVWTFTKPLPEIRRGDRISIRTHCPGRLTYHVDDAPDAIERLVAVGGVMAGPIRFQVTLGPFGGEANSLIFQFHCEHAGCTHESPCCMSGTRTVRIGGRRGGQRKSRT